MGLISVIICTYNRVDMLPDTLKTLKKSILASGKETEVIVINNNSSDNTDEVVSKFIENNQDISLKLVHESRPGLSYARNAGLRSARGDILCFLDDDVFVPEEWLGEICKTFENFHDCALAGKIALSFPEVKKPDWLDSRYYGFFSEYDHGGKDKALSKGSGFYGANFVLTRKIYETVGGFNENLGRQKGNLLSGEDGEYSKRIWDEGFSVAYCANGVVLHRVHPERITFRWFYRRYFWEGVSSYYKPKNHYPLYPLRRIPKLISSILTLIIFTLIFNKKKMVNSLFRIANALGPFYGWYLDLKK